LENLTYEHDSPGGLDMEASTTVEELCLKHRVDLKQLVERSGLDEAVIVAIVQGRRTPSPEERDRVAAVFGVTREQIAWGHKTPIQHIYGHGPG
jgi:transcriptional regulator with XRE-family HTH domain